MTDETQDSGADQQDNHTMAKVAVGAAVIGGIAATAAVLSNKDVQSKIGEGVHHVQAAGAKALDDLSAQFEDLKKKVGDAVADTETSEAAATLKKSLAEVGDNLKELRDAAGEDVNDLVEAVQARMDALRKDYGDMAAEMSKDKKAA